MSRDQVKPWRARLAASKDKDDFSDNPVGNRARGLELDLRLREFEISQLTQRNNFFMIFQGVLIAGLVQSQGTAAPLITFSMSLLGVATSVFQIGMAGGAKYWQSRWEASTRSSEIALVLELVKQRKLAVQTFTHDSKLLTKEEQKQIKDWNEIQPDRHDQITDDPKFIHNVVLKDIQTGGKCWLYLSSCYSSAIAFLCIHCVFEHNETGKPRRVWQTYSRGASILRLSLNRMNQRPLLG